jgi:hypothetical protein
MAALAKRTPALLVLAIARGRIAYPRVGQLLMAASEEAQLLHRSLIFKDRPSTHGRSQ